MKCIYHTLNTLVERIFLNELGFMVIRYQEAVQFL